MYIQLEKDDSQNQVCIKDAMVSPINVVTRKVNQVFVSFSGVRKDHRFVSINENKARITMKYVEKVPRATTWCSSNMVLATKQLQIPSTNLHNCSKDHPKIRFQNSLPALFLSLIALPSPNIDLFSMARLLRYGRT